MELLTEKKKTYRAVLRLGMETDTQDMTGTILLEERGLLSQKKTCARSVEAFWDISCRVPPMYSALKVNGKKLYELAREGKVVERAPGRWNFMK